MANKKPALPRNGKRAADPETASQTADKWCSPEVIVDALYEFTGGKQIELDPCSNVASIVGARVEWYGPEAGGTDGLLTPWLVPPGSTIFVNPPYSDKEQWMRKCANEAQRLAQHDVHILGLLPADTDTRWFHEYVANAARRCFWRGRLRFLGDRGDPARFPSLIPYWGLAPGHFQAIFSKYGWVV